jgi:glycosyltransferase involved in cell wall biosynthesis
MHVVYICNELPPATAGGIGPLVASLSTALVCRGHRVTIVGLYDKPYDWNLNGVRIAPIYSSYPRFWWRFKRFVHLYEWRRRAIHRKLLELHKSDPIDVIEWPDYEGLFLKPIQGVTDVLRTHGPLFTAKVFGLHQVDERFESLERNILRQIPNWIGISNWFLNFLKEQSKETPRRSTIIYNPVDTDLFYPSESQCSAKRVFYAGSLIERKGVMALASAANVFLQEDPEAELVLVGRDVCHQLPRIESILKPQIRDRVRMLHAVSQTYLASLFRECTVFAMPSIFESFGTVWADAMASGIPVVGSTLTCGPEIVPNGVAGILADPQHPEDVARAISTLLRDPYLRERMGHAGRKLALEKYSLDVVAGQTIDFYKSCREES